MIGSIISVFSVKIIVQYKKFGSLVVKHRAVYLICHIGVNVVLAISVFGNVFLNVSREMRLLFIVAKRYVLTLLYYSADDVSLGKRLCFPEYLAVSYAKLREYLVIRDPRALRIIFILSL